jgi:DNA polymerase-4
MPKMLIDCDAFFASCEQSRNPWLRGKKVLVTGDTERRSVITAASYEARAVGAKAGIPIQKARRLVPDGIFLVGDLHLYLDYNLKLFKKLRSYEHPVEIYSIDEFYLDFNGTYAEAVAMAREFKDWVRQELRITVSIGIAPTKVFAKLASEMKKPNGLTVLRPEDIPSRIENLPIQDLFGVGPRTAEFFRIRAVRTIGDLRAYDPLTLQAELGVRGKWLHEAAMGLNDEIVKVTPDPYKSMGNERTLPEDTNDPEKIRAFLYFLADHLAQRLRADGAKAQTVHLHVRYEDFTGFARSKTMPRPFCLTEDLMVGVDVLLKKEYRETKRMIRLLGIGASNLIRVSGEQWPLFPKEQKAVALAGALDKIRDTYGQNSIGRASTLAVAPKKPAIGERGPFAVVPGSGRGPRE